ncbi:MAG: hypothetical protein AAGG81_07255, partial [Chlamydiota bacterium]
KLTNNGKHTRYDNKTPRKIDDFCRKLIRTPDYIPNLSTSNIMLKYAIKRHTYNWAEIFAYAVSKGAEFEKEFKVGDSLATEILNLAIKQGHVPVVSFFLNQEVHITDDMIQLATGSLSKAKEFVEKEYCTTPSTPQVKSMEKIIEKLKAQQLYQSWIKI